MILTYLTWVYFISITSNMSIYPKIIKTDSGRKFACGLKILPGQEF